MDKKKLVKMSLLSIPSILSFGYAAVLYINRSAIPAGTMLSPSPGIDLFKLALGFGGIWALAMVIYFFNVK